MGYTGTGASGQTYIGRGVLVGSEYAPIGTLSGLAAHGVTLSQGAGAFTAVAPSATAGQALISTGAATDPVYGTVGVAGGGTGAVTLTGVLTGNGTGAFTASAITQYGTLVASTSNLMVSVAPSATSGVPLISQGAASNPAYGTAVVAGGGTGATSFTAYAVLCGGTTSTGAFQSIAGVGSAGQVLTSNGAGALPTFQAGGGGGGTVWALTTVNASIVSGNGYIANKGSLLTMTLPASGAISDSFEVTNINQAVGIRIAQNANQQIRFGTSTTTVGVGGYLESTALGDSLRLTVITSGASTVWIVLSAVGNWTVV